MNNKMRRTKILVCLLLAVLLAMTALSGCSGAKEKEQEQKQDAGIPIETVKTESFEMDYFKFGSGDKVFVILPGLSVQSVMNLADAVAESYSDFTEDYTIYLFDRRKDEPETYSVYDMARDTAAAFAELGLSKVDLYGVSQGGMIAMDIAIEHPELVNKLVLASVAARETDLLKETGAKWVQLAKAGDAEGLYLAFGEAVYSQETFEQYKETLISMSKTVTDEELARFVIHAEAGKGFDILDDVGRIECPVLLTGAEDDNVLGAEATREIAAKLEGHPGFELHMYDGYGHAAYDLAPDHKERIQKFLASE